VASEIGQTKRTKIETEGRVTEAAIYTAGQVKMAEIYTAGQVATATVYSDAQKHEANVRLAQTTINAAGNANATAATTRTSSCGTAAGTTVCGEYKTPTQVGTGPVTGPLIKP
jgi:hypothetical protein